MITDINIIKQRAIKQRMEADRRGDICVQI